METIQENARSPPTAPDNAYATSQSSSSTDSLKSNATIVGPAAPSSEYFDHVVSVPLPSAHHEESSPAFPANRAETPPMSHVQVYVIPPRKATSIIVALHHGAGSSAMTWALMLQDLRRLLPEAGFVAVDARGHGATKIYCDRQPEVQIPPVDNKAASHFVESDDYSLHVLANDFVAAVNYTCTKTLHLAAANPRIFLVGHSLGGAVVTHIASNRLFGNSLLGTVMIDVAEGYAKNSLSFMPRNLDRRRTSFSSLEDAISWMAIESPNPTLHNIVSARVSVPPLLIQRQQQQQQNDVSSTEWLWRTDLSKTAEYWPQWFEGLSKKFVESSGGKLLILADTDRLDKELTIGQMQGKFQMQVVPNSGHFVHEDHPDQVAEMIAEFMNRNDSEKLILPPKVSDMIAKGIKI